MFVLLVPAIYLTLTSVAYVCKDTLQKYNYDNIKSKYNIFMVSISVINFVATCYVHYFDNKFLNQYDIVCKPYSLTYISRFNANLFLYSKIFEWIDTFFLIAYNKKLSILHIFHHGSTFVLCYINIFPNINSLCGVSIITNAFVHAIMYSYYNGYFKAFRKYITQIQILQHIIVLYGISYVFFTKINNELCDTKLFDMYTTFSCYFAYLVLFANFYIQNNSSKNKIL